MELKMGTEVVNLNEAQLRMIEYFFQKVGIGKYQPFFLVNELLTSMRTPLKFEISLRNTLFNFCATILKTQKMTLTMAILNVS